MNNLTAKNIEWSNRASLVTLYNNAMAKPNVKNYPQFKTHDKILYSYKTANNLIKDGWVKIISPEGRIICVDNQEHGSRFLRTKLKYYIGGNIPQSIIDSFPPEIFKKAVVFWQKPDGWKTQEQREKVTIIIAVYTGIKQRDEKYYIGLCDNGNVLKYPHPYYKK